MQFDIITIFPEIFNSFLKESLIARAQKKGLLKIRVHNLRKWTKDQHKTVDDRPYGGGLGMVLKVEPIFKAVKAIKQTKRLSNKKSKIILFTPRGKEFNQKIAYSLSQFDQLILICGRYEGVDERVSQALVTEEISIGDYVLSGGELPALVLIEAISRMLPGVVGDWESVETDSFYAGPLGPPQYTRPPVFRGMEAPAVLREGNHAAIRRWRRKEALRATRARRPDLLVNLTEEDQKLLAEIAREASA